MEHKGRIAVRDSIRTKLLVLFLGLTTVTLFASGYLAVSTLFTASSSAQQVVQSALKKQAADFMVQLVEKTAQQNDAILETVHQDANYLALYASDIFTNSTQFQQATIWRVDEHMNVGGDGQFANDENDVVSVYVPNMIAINEEVISNLELGSHLDTLLKSSFESSENITAIYLGTEGEITRYYPNINLGTALPPDFRVSQRPWYTNAVEENPDGSVVWSEIYEDATGQGLLVTAAIPVYRTDNLIGVIGIDVSLDDIEATVKNTQVFENSYTFLIDETGRAIVLPEQGYLDIFNQSLDSFETIANLKDNGSGFDPLIEAMLAKETGFKEIQNDDDILFVAYAPLNITGWSLATVVPESQLLESVTLLQQELSENTRQLVFTRILSLGLFLLAFTIIIGVWATNQLVNPIQELVAAVQKIGTGDWTSPLRRMRKDEIGVLSNTFQNVTNQLHNTLNSLEERIDERTKDLEYKAVQLEAASQVAQDALASQDVRTLLPKVTQLISERFGYYHTGIFLLDSKREFAILQAASSEGGQRMLERGHQLRIGSEGIVGLTAVSQRPHIALDVGTDAVFFDNPELPQTRSEIALPLLIQDSVIGILDIQSTEAQAFDHHDLEIFQTLANQLALAIQNASLIEETQAHLAQLKYISAENAQEAWRERLKSQHHGFRFTPLGINTLERSEAPKTEEDTEDVALPIILRSTAIGTLTLKRASREWTKKEQVLIADVANQIGLAVENTRLVEETREQANRDQLVSGFSSKLRETLDMDTVVKTAIEEMRKTFNLDEIEVRLNLPEDNEVEN
ncbi:MAG: GAF domain-containing protein [Anaerolineae bacterium]|jgi:GAF domain-containing protein/HAMP domain-containing protein|nr:GAF domain-containing protein [Anaerolineae bacterium]MBT3712316.1 GAF domain-containing protein [Anaerolineae bacterium]MBT4311471.1 GAF domain-containing protein [Anaerolineae bacterium]MBT4458651.1 GAF domain-containing protein [Anaerolineae bacterium]MBT6062977.1 GAF domain-containing protein [Anaerolineae bacterium]